MHARPFCNLALVFIATVLVPAGFSQEYPAQQVHRDGFEPVNDEVYSLIKHFYDYDKTYDLRPAIVESASDTTYSYEKIAITASNDERIPIDIYFPVAKDRPRLVMLLHGLGNSKERWQQSDRISLTSRLLESGYAVAAIDLQFHGERSIRNDYQNPVFLTFGDSLFVRSRNMLVQSTIDVRRSIDYLSSRDDIDVDGLSLVGYSMGAMIASFVAALEVRTKTAVLCAIPTTQQPFMIDPYNFASRSAARTVVLAGRSDWVSSPADLRRLVDLLPDGSRLQLYEGGHSLPSEFTASAFNWIVDR